jgi:hypothetical protein
MIADGPERWNELVTGLNTVIDEADEHTRFGLMLFPALVPNSGAPTPPDCSVFELWSPDYITCITNTWTAEDCSPAILDVPIALGNASAISAALATEEPYGGTPTDLSLQRAKAQLAGSARPTRIVLITDGEPNCGGSPESTVTALEELARAGHQTYVIGVDIATGGSIQRTLDSFAKAGGTGETSYRAVVTAGEVAQNIRSLLEPVDCTP